MPVYRGGGGVKASGIPEPEIMLSWLYYAGDLAPQSEQMGVESRDAHSVSVHHYFVLVLHACGLNCKA